METKSLYERYPEALENLKLTKANYERIKKLMNLKVNIDKKDWVATTSYPVSITYAIRL